MMNNVRVSCPVQGAFEIDRRGVTYRPNGDQTATYWFDCVQCGTEHMRHATIGVANQLKRSGVQRADARSDMPPLSEREIEAFALELSITEDIMKGLT